MCPLLRYPAYRELNRALLRFAFYRFANCDQEDGSVAGRMRREKVGHVVIKKREPGRTQAQGIRGQVHPAANGARFQLDGAVATVPVTLQDEFQIGEKEDVHAGVRRKLLIQSKVVGFGPKFPFLQKLQGLPLKVEEVGTRLERLHRMHDQIKIVELRAGRLEKVSRKTLGGAVENG